MRYGDYTKIEHPYKKKRKNSSRKLFEEVEFAKLLDLYSLNNLTKQKLKLLLLYN